MGDKKTNLNHSHPGQLLNDRFSLVRESGNYRVIKTHVYEIIWIKTQINLEFLVKKKYRGEKSQIPILQGQILEEQKI